MPIRAAGSYSNTESFAIAAFARMYFDQDKQRLLLGGFHGKVNNEYVAYRESLGGDYSFDAYSLTAKKFIQHGKSNVLAARIDGRWTSSAITI